MQRENAATELKHDSKALDDIGKTIKRRTTVKYK